MKKQLFQFMVLVSMAISAMGVGFPYVVTPGGSGSNLVVAGSLIQDSAISNTVVRSSIITNSSMVSGGDYFRQSISNTVLQPYQPYVANHSDPAVCGAYSFWRSNYMVSVDYTNANGVVIATAWNEDELCYQNTTIKKNGVNVVSPFQSVLQWDYVESENSNWGWPQRYAMTPSGTIGFMTNATPVGFELVGKINKSDWAPYLSPDAPANLPRMIDGAYTTRVERGAILNGYVLNLAANGTKGIVRSIYIMGGHITEEDPYWLRGYPDCGSVNPSTLVAATNGAAINMWIQALTSHVYDHTNKTERFWSTPYANIQRGAEVVHSFELKASIPFTNGIVIAVWNKTANRIANDAQDGPWWMAVTYELGSQFAHVDDGKRMHLITTTFSQTMPTPTTLPFVNSPYGPGVLLGLWLSAKPLWPQSPAGTSGFFEGGWFLNGSQIAAGGDDIFVAGYTFGSYYSGVPKAFSSTYWFGVPSVADAAEAGGYVECYKMWGQDAPFWRKGQPGEASWKMTNGDITANQEAVFTALYYAPMHP